MAQVKTDKRTVLQAVKDRLIASVSDLNDTNCIISGRPGDPPEGLRHNEFVTVSMPGGSFHVDSQIGGGIASVFYDASIAVICWSMVGRQDRPGEDEDLFLDADRGLFQLELAVVKALAGHELVDGTGGALGGNILALSDSDPRVSEEDDTLGDLQILFQLPDMWWNLS